MRDVLSIALIFTAFTTTAQDSITVCAKVPMPLPIIDTVIIDTCSGGGVSEITPNIYNGLGYSDTKKIQLALNKAISKRKKLFIGYNEESDSNLWLIDSAILLSSNSDIVIRNAKLKLTDSSRDNIFRTANCGFGITNPGSNPMENISIVGEGLAILEGADNPRSSGGYTKTLSLNPDAAHWISTYGTDAGKPGRAQVGDWRNNGVIIAYTDGITFTGITLNYLHCYGATFERSKNIKVKDISINMPGYPASGDTAKHLLNMGPLDFSQGTTNVTVENISGFSEDDIMAFNITNIPNGAGIYKSYYPIGDTSNSLRDSSYNIYVNNVQAGSFANIVRIMVPPNGVKAKNITINNVRNSVNAANTYFSAYGNGANSTAIVIGTATPPYGGPNYLGQISNININNITTDSTAYGVRLNTTLSESSINEVRKYSTVYLSTPPFYSTNGAAGLRNVTGINAGSANIAFNDLLNVQPTLTVTNPNSGGNAQSRISLILGSDKGTGLTKGASFWAKTPTSWGLADYENRPFYIYVGNIMRLSIATTGNATLVGSLTATQFRLSALNTAPASSTAAGTTGEIRIVDGFIYVCVAANTWQRATLSTF